jgi:hypothetical protein
MKKKGKGKGKHKQQAAWRWMHTRAQGRSVVSLAAALLSRLVAPFILVACKPDNKVYDSMGNASWACFGLALDSGGHRRWPRAYGVPIRGGRGVVHDTYAGEWEVIPSVGERCARGIILKQTAESIPLIRYAVLHRTSNLSHQEMLSCAMLVGLYVPNTILRVDLLRALHAHYGHLFEERSGRKLVLLIWS